MKKLFYVFPFLFIFLLLTSYTSTLIFEKIPHSQDEVAYLFQAKIFKSGHLYLNSLPDSTRRFFDQEFIVNNGKWFGKYPPGQSFFLTLGLLLDKSWLVNPIFGTASLLLIFYFVLNLFSKKTAILTTLLFSLSPFYILISSTFLSHTPTLFFTVLFILSIFKIVISKKYNFYWVFFLGFSLGIVFLLRPYNIIPMILFALIIFFYHRYLLKQKLLIFWFLLIFTIFISIGLIYNFLLTGSFIVTPLQVYSQYDFPGFGVRGVEWGMSFTPKEALSNTLSNLASLKEFLIPQTSIYLFLFIPFAYISKRRLSIYLFGFFILLILLYFFYFHPGTFLGPRYWFESSWILLILISEGIIFLLSFISKNLHIKLVFQNLIFIFIVVILLMLLSKNIIPFLSSFKGYNGMIAFTIPNLDAPSIIFVSGETNWQAYGKYLTIQSPTLEENKIIFVRNRAIHNVPKDIPPLDNQILKQHFPNRKFFLLVNQDLREINF